VSEPGEVVEVVIAVTGCSVTVKGPGEMKDVAAQALEIYRQVHTADMERTGPAIGFTNPERRWSRQTELPIDPQ
jgi:hypothetical protein